MDTASQAINALNFGLGITTPQKSERVDQTVTVALAESPQELFESFHILYDAYRQAGLVQSNPFRMRITPYHTLETTEVMIAKIGGVINSTLTMTGDGTLGLPMDSMYAEETTWLRSRGYRLAEIGSLADRRNSTVRFVKVFKELAKLVVQAAASRGYTGLVIATHPRHAGFYVRSFGFTEIGGLTQCPYAQGNPAVALLLDFEAIRGTHFEPRLFQPAIDARRLSRTQWPKELLEVLANMLRQMHGG